MTGVFGDASGSQGFARRTALAGKHLNPELRGRRPTNIPDGYNDITPGFHSRGTLRDCLLAHSTLRSAVRNIPAQRTHLEEHLFLDRFHPDSISLPIGLGNLGSTDKRAPLCLPYVITSGGFLWFPSLCPA